MVQSLDWIIAMLSPEGSRGTAQYKRVLWALGPVAARPDPRALSRSLMMSSAAISYRRPLDCWSFTRLGKPLAFALGVGVAISAMSLTGTLHPPAGADPIVVIFANASWPFLFCTRAARNDLYRFVRSGLPSLDHAQSYPLGALGTPARLPGWPSAR
jgi:hypothetical protein